MHFIWFFVLVLCASINQSLAQQPETIRVRRESDLVKAYFDPSELKLLPIDRFGNPQDNKIMAFKLYVKNGRETKVFEAYSNALTAEMLTYLNGLKEAAKIFFTEIKVQDNDQKLMKLPDVIEVWFPQVRPQPSGKHKR